MPCKPRCWKKPIAPCKRPKRQQELAQASAALRPLQGLAQGGQLVEHEPTHTNWNNSVSATALGKRGERVPLRRANPARGHAGGQLG